MLIAIIILLLQVIQCEEDKEALNKRVGELSDLNADLQNHLSALRHELAVANAELRVRVQAQAQTHARDPEHIQGHNSDAQRDALTASLQVTASSTQTATTTTTAYQHQDDSGAGMTAAAARRSLQAAEAYGKDLHRQ